VVGDVDALYRALSPQLEQIVRFDVRAPKPVIEDACQTAWSRLIHHSEGVRREAVLSWLAKTAVREAFKLSRRDGRELSLDAELDGDGELPSASPRPGPAEMLELRERLAEVRRLPTRQQRLVWMSAIGLSYVEMAELTGDSKRTIERQLLRAKGALADDGACA
jgi:RNA polymerase sigma factor (sigma-70 family)